MSRQTSVAEGDMCLVKRGRWKGSIVTAAVPRGLSSHRPLFIDVEMAAMVSRGGRE